jgi:hypothetical protein
MECSLFPVLTSLGSCGGYSYFPIDFGGSANWTWDTQVAFAPTYHIEQYGLSHRTENAKYRVLI